ncbi:hypothetical protein Tco_1476045 [Tanacetum coccineum]
MRESTTRESYGGRARYNDINMKGALEYLVNYEYQTFRAKPYDSLSQTHTRYKTLLNELSNDGVTLSKREINVVFVNSLPERSVYKDNLIQRRISKKILMMRQMREPMRMSNISSVSKGFQPNFTPKLIQSSQPAKSSQNKPKIQKDYKAEYKKMKAKLALLEAIPSTSHSLKTFQSKNKGLVAETFDWDEEEVYDDEEMPQVKVLVALANDELSVGKNHARNGEWIDITMRKCRDDLLALKQAKLDVVTFQIQNTELTNEQIPNQKKKILDGELLAESSLKNDVKENAFITASLDYDHEMIPKSKDWVKRHNLDNKLINFNTRRILVLKSQAVNECLKLTKAYNDPESSKDSGSESLTLLPPLKNLQRASPSSKVMSLTYQDHSLRERPGLVPTEVKNTEKEPKINELIKLVQMLINEKVNSSQKI